LRRVPAPERKIGRRVEDAAFRAERDAATVRRIDAAMTKT